MMRMTNGMMMNTTKLNINNNKVSVDRLNTQMSTQKKITKPSDNPLIAIKSLRLSTTLSQINQYYTNNIKDACHRDSDDKYEGCFEGCIPSLCERFHGHVV